MQANSCASALTETVSQGAGCLFAKGIDYLLDEGAEHARTLGVQAFGPHFQVVAQPGVSALSDGVRIGGELDVVVPFAGGKSLALGEPSTSALFMQQGISRWWDSDGNLHNDLRYGLVYRYRLGSQADADVLGVSLLQQQQFESRHEGVVSGIDYAGPIRQRLVVI